MELPAGDSCDDRDAPPVFFGPYGLADPAPALLAPNVVCLDDSVARGGFLCGYRWEGEATIALDRFTTIPARREPRAESGAARIGGDTDGPTRR